MKKKTIFISIIIAAVFLFATSAYALQGDFDGSGVVDGADLATLSTSFGSDPESSRWDSAADITGSNLVDGDDLTLLAPNFGIGVGTGSVAAKVVWGDRGAAKTASGVSSKALFKAPLSVVTVRIEVSGPGMTTMSSDFDASAGSGIIAGVPAGSNRTVTIMGLDSEGTTQYTGSETVTVLKDQTATVDIFLATVTSVVAVPTGFTANSIPGGISLSWMAPVDAVGYRVYYGTTSHDYTDSVDVGNATGYLITGLSAGTYYVALTAIDAAGLESWYADYTNEVSVDVTFDPDDPTGSIKINSDDLFIDSSSATVDITATDNSAVTGYYLTDDSSYMPIDSDWVAVMPSVDFSDSVSFTLSSVDGITRVYLWVKDGNSNQLVVDSDDIILDTAPPFAGSITITSGSFANTTAITLSLAADDAVGVTGYYLSESSTTPVSTDPDWVTVTSATRYSDTSVNFTLSSGDGIKNIYAWFKDDAGYVSAVASDVVILDTVPAPSGSVSVNSGLFTNTTAITLSLVADDSVGVTGYYLSESSTTPASTDAGWVSVTSTTNYSDTTVNFTVTSGDGEKYIYAWFKDDAGNVSGVSSDTVTLDTAVPGSISDESAMSDIGAITLSWTNPSSDFNKVVIRSDTTAYPASPTDGRSAYDGAVQTFNDVNLDPASTYYYVIFAYDAAGNYDNGVQVSASPLSTTPLLAGGFGHSLALTANGAVLGWGLNDLGQIGDGTTANKISPVNISQINNFRGVASIDAESDHSIAVTGAGEVWTWGDNDCGQLGNRKTGDCDATNTPTEFETVPVTVANELISDQPLENISSIHAGAYFSAVLKNDSTVWTWGDNLFAQLGDGSKELKNAPVQVAVDFSTKLTGVSAISAGGNHTLALKSDGTVWAWGFNASGQLGDGSQGGDSEYAKQVQGQGGTGNLIDVVAVAAGAYHSVALASNSTVWAWGDKDFGQLGDNTQGDGVAGTNPATDIQTTPVQVVGPGGSGTLTNIKAIAAGDYFTLALAYDGTLYAWGRNDYGQLGVYPATPLSRRAVPELVPGFGFASGVESIHTGDDHVLIMMDDGTVWTWGNDEFGQLGDGTPGDGDVATKEFNYIPAEVPGLNLKNYPYYP